MKWMGVVTKLTEVTVAVAFAGMTVLVALEVFLRYVVGRSLYVSEELARFLFVWIGFLAASLALRSGIHVGFEALVLRLSPPARRRVGAAIQVPILGFLLIVTVMGVAVVFDSVGEMSPTLGIQMVWARLSVPIGAILMTLQVVDGLVRTRTGSLGQTDRSRVE